MATNEKRAEAQGPHQIGMSRRNFLGRALGFGVSLATGGALLQACGTPPTTTPTAAGSSAGTAAGGALTYTGPKVQVPFWNGFSGPNGKYLRGLIEQFNAANPNIEVQMNAIPWDEYYQKVPQAVSSGEGPVIGIMHTDTLGTNAARNVIVPLEADMVASLGLQESDFDPRVWNAGMYNSQRYGIPLDVHPFGLYYNKGVFEQAGLDPNKPPQTGDEYLSALAQLKEKGIQGGWVTPLQSGALMFHSLLWQFGGDLYNAALTEVTWNSDAGVKALTWMVDLVKQGYSPQNVGADAEVISFKNNQNAFLWNGVWHINSLNETQNLKWGVAPLPQVGTEKAAWAGSHNFVIMRQRGADDNRLQAARVFISWLSKNSTEWARAGQVPAAGPAREAAEFKALPAQSIFATELPYVRFLPTIPGTREVHRSTIDVAVNEAVLLTKEPKQALDDAAKLANQLLEENRAKYKA